MICETMRTWAEIHMDRLDANYHTIRKAMPAGCRYLAIVKANAYGHGAVPVAKRYEALGADYLAVACISEAIELRQAGISLPILILGYTPVEAAAELLQYRITQAIYDQDMAEAFSAEAVKLGGRILCHIKLDTGMSRLGFLCDEQNAAQSIDRIEHVVHLPGLDAEGMFTHFAVADSDDESCIEYSRKQIRRFNTVRDALIERGFTPRISHCDASAALMNYPESCFDMVRPGIIQYGYHPDPSTRGKMELQPVMELKTRVASLKTFPAGTTISYGRTASLTRESRVAVVPVGYADGLFRLLSNRQEMLLRGTAVKQIGRVCMDMCMLDVTDLPEAAIGDEVTVFGAGLSLDDKADTAGTITYEMLCDISPRVPRVYL